MRASTALWIGLAFFGALAIGLVHLFTEGALFSTAHHEWRIDVDAEGDAPWSLEVPSLAATGDSVEPLDALLAKLRVAGGNATIERNATVVRIDGSGDVSVVAHREFWGMRSAPFRDIHATRSDAARLDADGPPDVRVAWSLDLVAGGGHTCGGSGTWAATLGPAGRAPLVAREVAPVGPADAPLTTRAPPVMMWCN